MTMYDNTLLAPQTEAASPTFIVEGGEAVTVTVHGLSGAETAAVQNGLGDRRNPTWANCYDGDTGDAIVFSPTIKQLLFHAPGLYRIVKGTTAVATGVYIDR